MARSKKRPHPHVRRRSSRLPSIPILGGHVDYLRSRPRPEKRLRRNWSLRVNYHQRSGSPFSYRSHPREEKAKHLAAKSWTRAKTSSSIYLQKARRAAQKLKRCSCKDDGSTFTETKKSYPVPQKRCHQKSRGDFCWSLNKLAEKTTKTSQYIQQKLKDLRYAINTSTKLASTIANAKVVRNNARKSFGRKKKKMTEYVEKVVSKAEKKVLEETGIDFNLGKLTKRRRGNDRYMERNSRTQEIQSKAGRGRATLRRAKGKMERGPDHHGTRLWGPRVAPAPEKRWRV